VTFVGFLSELQSSRLGAVEWHVYTGPVRLVVIVPFLNEARHLPTLLGSIERQTRRPDVLLLADDGSTDASAEMAREFAETREWVRLIRRESRPAEKDRLATASELGAFHRALATLDDEYDVVAKMDADLQLVPDHLETVLAAFEAEPRLGISGTYLAACHPDGRVVRERHPAEHVPGPNKFYRRECFEQIAPLPEILGWDGFDGIRARARGWETRSVACEGGDSLHLRPTGTHDGMLRAYRRWGTCAWGWGAHPLYVVLGGIYRLPNRPYVVGGLSYIYGYLRSALRGDARVDAATRAHAQREEKARMRGLLFRTAA
jgi:poly-beta-1,6-N-acetyl-D-glucosamine synthase